MSGDGIWAFSLSGNAALWTSETCTVSWLSFPELEVEALLSPLSVDRACFCSLARQGTVVIVLLGDGHASVSFSVTDVVVKTLFLSEYPGGSSLFSDDGGSLSMSGGSEK